MDSMLRLPAGDNLSVDIQPNRWRLLFADADADNGMTRARVLVEAVPGQALRYTNSFAARRRLPPESLPPAQIRQVVAGWSADDARWHLGLVVAPELAAERGSRWVEMASWPDPTQTTTQAAVQQAGIALGEVLGVPFRLIPPRVAPEIAAPVADLPALPLQLGIWTLERAVAEDAAASTGGGGEALRLRRSARWTRGRLLRALWYALWMAIFAALSVATLTTELALPNSGMMLPNPQILPYLGLATAAVLAALIVSILREVLANPDRVLIDPASRSIVGLTGGVERWRHDADDVQAIYASQVVGQRGDKRTLYHGELNLQLDSSRFFSVLTTEQEEEQRGVNGARPIELVEPLDPRHVETDLQAAALYLADALGGKPCWYDQRTQ